MARQRDSKIVGTFGNLIFYNAQGDYRMRVKPTHVKRTAASVKSGLNFGRASKICRQIRGIILPFNPDTDNSTMNPFTGAMNKFLNWKEKQVVSPGERLTGLPFIQGFQFNDQADLTGLTDLQIDEKMNQNGSKVISLAPIVPDQSLHAPANAISIKLTMIVLGINLTESRALEIDRRIVEVPNDSEKFYSPDILIDDDKNSFDLIVAILGVRYMVNNKGRTEELGLKREMPFGIVYSQLNVAKQDGKVIGEDAGNVVDQSIYL